MELLCQSFMEIPVDVVALQGLIQLIVVSGVLIFKFMIPIPKKVKNDEKDRLL